MARPIPLARGRTHTRVAGRMNGYETKYSLILEAERRRGDIAAWWYESVKLKLAPATFLTMDFMVLYPDGLVELVDVKGSFQEDDARVKLKVAAETYPLFRFKVAALVKGTWRVEGFDR